MDDLDIIMDMFIFIMRNLGYIVKIIIFFNLNKIFIVGYK